MVVASASANRFKRHNHFYLFLTGKGYSVQNQSEQKAKLQTYSASNPHLRNDTCSVNLLGFLLDSRFTS